MALDPQIQTVMSRMRDVERRLLDIELSNTRAGNTSITNGALIIRDQGRQVRARYGLLDDGTYGLALYDAAGYAMPLSQIAFGLAGARTPDQISLTANSPNWVRGAPSVDVYVNARMRVDVAGWVIVGGLNLRMAMSYSVVGPSPNDQPDGAGPVAQAPSEARALAMISKGNAISYEVAAGFPDLVEGLAPGWYRVHGEYQLLGEQNPSVDTFGYAINRRIFAQPY